MLYGIKVHKKVDEINQNLPLKITAYRGILEKIANLVKDHNLPTKVSSTKVSINNKTKKHEIKSGRYEFSFNNYAGFKVCS